MLKIIAKKSIPLIIAYLGGQLMAFVDITMVGSLGKNALSGMGIAIACLMLPMAVFMGTGSAYQTEIARADSDENRMVFLSSVLLGLTIVGIIVTLFFYAITPFLSRHLIHVIAAQAYIRDYLYGWIFPGIILSTLLTAFNFYLYGVKKVALTMWISLGGIVLNCLFNWVLIFGHLGFPALGVKGAAISSVAAMAVQVIVYSIIFKKSLLPVRWFMPSWSQWIYVIKRGSALSAHAALERIFVLASCYFIGYLGVLALSISYVLFMVLTLIVMAFYAIGIVTQSFISHAVEQTNHIEARKWRRTAQLVMLLFGTALTGIMMLMFDVIVPLLWNNDMGYHVFSSYLIILAFIALVNIFVTSSRVYFIALRKGHLDLAISGVFNCLILVPFIAIAAYNGASLLFIWLFILGEETAKGFTYLLVTKHIETTLMRQQGLLDG